MLFLGIISWKGTSHFNGGVVFQMGASFLSRGGVCPMEGASILMGRFEKKCWMGGHGWGIFPHSGKYTIYKKT